MAVPRHSPSSIRVPLAMSTAFPLLSLPHLAFEHVHQYFKIPELINLSQCSKRVKNLSEFVEMAGKGTDLEVQVSKNSAVINVERKNDEQFCWRISLKKDPELANVKELKEKRIGGANRKMVEVRDGWLSVAEEGRFEEDIISVVKLIKDLFKGEIAKLNLCFDSNHNFEKLLVASDTLHCSKSIIIGNAQFTHSEMKFMLDNFVTDDLRMEGFTGPNFIYSKPLNYPLVQISDAPWISGRELLEMSYTCRKIELDGACLISNEDLNQLVKRWLSSTNRTLELVTIITQPSDTSFSIPSRRRFHYLDLREVLNGVPIIAREMQRRDPSKNYYDDLCCERGIDIRRADGVMATAMIVMLDIDGDSVSQFEFTVWSD